MKGQTVSRPTRLQGEVTVPGDKSISHRAVMFGALADGTATVRNFLMGADCLATIECMRALGAEVTINGPSVTVTGHGHAGLREPTDVLDCQNSGTTMRLLAGVLAGRPMLTVLTGDGSLRRRPMERIITPLRSMGAHIWARDGGRMAPLAIQGGSLIGVSYPTPVASAQVKSAVLLAALTAEGASSVIEPATSRDHTERMLSAMGAQIRTEGHIVHVAPLERALQPVDIDVPGDVSSAAFWLVAAVCHPAARVTLGNVGMNPTRAGVVRVLQRMGGRLTIENERTVGGEPVADLVAESSELRATEIGGAEIPTLIDEIPALVVAALCARGDTVIRDAAELRVKETDRIAAVVAEFGRLGAGIEPREDGMLVQGDSRLRGASVDPRGDHRLAMALAVAGLMADGETLIGDPDCVAVSYPTFWQDLTRLSGA